MRATLTLFVFAEALRAAVCSVDGSVVNAVTGEPVPRAIVTLMGPGGQSGMSADDSGRWTFANAACGQIQITATRPGFIQGGSGAPRLGAAFRPMILEPGSPLHDLKIQLTPQAVVVGKVTDDHGDPVMNAQVSAMVSRVVDGRRTFQPSGAANTNDLGDFRISSLQPGRYIVCVRANVFRRIIATGDSAVASESCYPGPIDGGAASAMEMAPGMESRVDFNLREVPAVHVRGVISGLPKNQGVGVQLVKRGGPPGMGSRAAGMAQDGSFDIQGVTPGAYTLTSDYFDSGKRLIARLAVDVGNSDIEGLILHFEPAFSVTGTVRVQSGGNNAKPNQQINVALRSADPMAGGGRLTWNADRTLFTINELTPGAYRLEAFGPRQLVLRSAMLGGRDISREEISLTQSSGPIEVVMSDDAGSVEGHVVDSGSRPVESWVMLLEEGRPPRNQMTGPDGHFRIDNVAPGSYQILAWDDAQQVEYRNADWMRQNASGSLVSVQSGQTVQVDLTQRSASPR